MDPGDIVGILPEPSAAMPCQLIAGYCPLSADFGSQESKSDFFSHEFTNDT